MRVFTKTAALERELGKQNEDTFYKIELACSIGYRR